MRHAEILHNWRRLREKGQQQFQLQRVKQQGLPGIAEDEIIFNGPITALCGLNGSGKTTVLRYIWYALVPETAISEPGTLERTKDGWGSIEYVFRGSAGLINVGGEQGLSNAKPVELPVEFLDPGDCAIRLKAKFRETASVGSAINGVEPYEFPSKALALVKRILRKDYSSVEIYDIDYAEENLPYIKATERGKQYDVFTMSLGEISVIYLVWRMSLAEKGTFFLLEEPECFLSPVAQRSLIDYFATISNDRRYSLVMTTHSPEIIKPLRAEETKVFYQGPSGVRVETGDQAREIFGEVGINSLKRLLVLCEDQVARYMVGHIIREFNSRLFAEMEVVAVGGESSLKQILSNINSLAGIFRIVGAFDGDMRSQEGLPATAPYVFLPGNRAPEEELREAVHADIPNAARIFGKPHHQIESILAEFRGIDAHDWFEGFRRRTLMSYDVFFDKVFTVWLERNLGAAEALSKSIEEKTF